MEKYKLVSLGDQQKDARHPLSGVSRGNVLADSIPNRGARLSGLVLRQLDNNLKCGSPLGTVKSTNDILHQSCNSTASSLRVWGGRQHQHARGRRVDQKGGLKTLQFGSRATMSLNFDCTERESNLSSQELPCICV